MDTLFIEGFGDEIPDKIGIVQGIGMLLFEEGVNDGGNVLVGFSGDNFSQLVRLEGKWLSEVQEYVVHLSTNDSIYFIFFGLWLIWLNLF